MTARSNILIVGGYGQVGHAVAELLAPMQPGRVIVAGRRIERARAAAAAIGHGTGARAFDLFAGEVGDALDGVGLVIVCLDQDDPRFVEACLRRGVHYVDISAHYGFLEKVEALDELAREGGATAILSVGVSPGLTNLLAARAVALIGSVDRLDIVVELGLGDHHGRAAIEWTLDNLDARFEITENWRAKAVRSLRERIELEEASYLRKGPAYRFNFSDQHVLARTLDVPTVSSWLRFSSRIATWLVARTSRLGLAWLLRRGWLRRFAVWLLTSVHVGSDRCVIAVRASGVGPEGTTQQTLSVASRREARMTAIVAAESARQVLDGHVAAGVFHSEQVLCLDAVLAALRRELPETAIDVPQAPEPDRESASIGTV